MKLTSGKKNASKKREKPESQSISQKAHRQPKMSSSLFLGTTRHTFCLNGETRHDWGYGWRGCGGEPVQTHCVR